MKEEGLPLEDGPFFAPLGRATSAEVSDQANLCLVDPVIHAVLEAVDSYALVLNPQRQILAANPVLLEALSEGEPMACRGLKLGEVLECVHVSEGTEGCGTSMACRRCGALLAMLATIDTGQAASGEYLISIQRNGRWEAREFMVRTRPLTVAGHRLTLLTLQDISAQKRREALERVFLHDLMNALHGLRNWTELLRGAGAEATTVAERIIEVAGHLTDEVESQRRLLQAEQGELNPDLRHLTPDGVLDSLMASVDTETVAHLVRLPTDPNAQVLLTDPAILGRILTNMVLNALEAVPHGGQAKIWYELRSGHPTFIVQNPGCMAPEVAERIFQRSFSTKAPKGRGLGTYGMKLLGETVLGGQVGFTTNWEEGTRFFITLPG